MLGTRDGIGSFGATNSMELVWDRTMRFLVARREPLASIGRGMDKAHLMKTALDPNSFFCSLGSARIGVRIKEVGKLFHDGTA